MLFLVWVNGADLDQIVAQIRHGLPEQSDHGLQSFQFPLHFRTHKGGNCSIFVCPMFLFLNETLPQKLEVDNLVV